MVKPPHWWGRMWAGIGVAVFVFVVGAIVWSVSANNVELIVSECSLVR